MAKQKLNNGETIDKRWRSNRREAVEKRSESNWETIEKEGKMSKVQKKQHKRIEK